MAKGIAVLFVLVVSALTSAHAQQAEPVPQPIQSHVVPLTKFPGDRRSEIVSGDPAKSGEPFVIRLHREAGYIIMPHTHSVDENIVVVQGTWALGMGDHYNPSALEPMEVGAYVLAPKRMAHFALSKTETVIQVHGIGPFTTHWIVPVYVLTDKGVLLEASPDEPGQVVSTSPAGCFALKLGAHIRSSYGDGVVVGARCTRGQLTQYRIESSELEHFWARRGELNAN
ncbi:MAG TPA: cupin domain-containing protein [Steroidobacteraceae bacterium]